MEAKDLMTGDYVQHKRTKEVIWIFEIDADRNVINNEPDGYCSEKNIFIDDIEPIPLTPEILEKNGFIHDDDNDNKYYWNWGVIDNCISYDNETNTIRVFHALGHLAFVHLLSYVHELQHALRLCGIKKEIIL